MSDELTGLAKELWALSGYISQDQIEEEAPSNIGAVIALYRSAKQDTLHG